MLVRKNIKIIKKLLVILILSIIIGCSGSENKMTEDELKSYGITNDQLVFYKLDYDDFIKVLETSNFNGIVFFVRSDCSYCHEMFKLLSELSKEKILIQNFYLVDSMNMTLEQKEDAYDKFGITSVPSILKFKNSNLKSIDVGSFNQKYLYDILKEK